MVVQRVQLRLELLDPGQTPWPRAAFDPAGRINPDKVLPRASRCGELGGDIAALPEGAWV
mgnify:CR=1 FL=1